MRKLLLSVAVAGLTFAASAQQTLRITYDGTCGTSGLAGATAVHIHSGASSTSNTGNWSFVVGAWGDPASPGTMTAGTTANTHTIDIDPIVYYSQASNGPIPSGDVVTKIGCVFRESGPCGGFGGVTTPCLEGKDINNQDFFIDLTTTPPTALNSDGTASSCITAQWRTGTRNIVKNEVFTRVSPNPVVDNATITYQVANKAQSVNIAVFNAMGQQITSLVNTTQAPGLYNTPFNTQNLASGVYFYKVTVGENTGLGKIVVK